MQPIHHPNAIMIQSRYLSHPNASLQYNYFVIQGIQCVQFIRNIRRAVYSLVVVP